MLSGVVYTARDAAHQRLVHALDSGKKLPFDIAGQTLYYAGPSPARPGRIIGSAGPTTSQRMDSYTPRLLAAGLRAMIGKGARSQEVKEAIKRYKAVYLVTIGGAGALLAGAIRRAEVIAYEDLGAEAVWRLEIESFPAIVANDIYGGDLFEQGKRKYRLDRNEGGRQMECVFCQIIAGKISSETVYQDEKTVAFRDIHPRAPTHLLIVPRKHIPTLAHVSEADSSIVAHMVNVANQLARSEGIAEKGYRVVINCGQEGGQLVPHLHMHLLGGRQLTGLLG